MDRIANDKYIWKWEGLSFDAYGLAVQYYEFNVLSRFHDLTLDQIKTLACVCDKPDRHDVKLTHEILSEMSVETYKGVKKKLLENLPMQELHKELTESSARFESGMTENTKQKESTS